MKTKTTNQQNQILYFKMNFTRNEQVFDLDAITYRLLPVRVLNQQSTYKMVFGNKVHSASPSKVQ